MTKQDFIFSSERKYRLIRHIAFWVAWWFAYFLFFHLPQHAIFGWNVNEANIHLRENGFLWILKMMVFNVFLAVVVPQMIFTYTLLYFILPRFFYQKRKTFHVVTAVVVFLGSYLILSACFKIFSQLPNYWMGLRKTFPWPGKLSFFAAFRDTLIALPIIAGLALTLKLMKRWWLKEKETQQIAEEKIKAELQLLKAQIHPHFLFNTLNNIYYFTLSGSNKAPEMIKKLSDLLKYILNEGNLLEVPLERELKMIVDYVSLEEVRYGNQMHLSVELPDYVISGHEEGSGWLLAPLLLIPFVENSFKHGASKMLNQSYIRLRVTIEDDELHFFITNGCPTLDEITNTNSSSNAKPGNVGLKNVKKRLELLYPGKHELTILPEAESFTVYLVIKLRKSDAIIENFNQIKPTIVYDGA